MPKLIVTAIIAVVVLLLSINPLLEVGVTLSAQVEPTLSWKYNIPPFRVIEYKASVNRTHNFGSPIVVDDVLYIGCTDGPQGGIFALDCKDGSKIWNYTVGWEGSEPRSLPAFSNGVIYASTGFSGLYALNAYHGGLNWKFTTVNEDTGGGFAMGPSPTVHEGKVFIGSFNGKFYALDANDGHVLWDYQVEHSSLGLSGVGTASTVADGIVYFGSLNQNVYALDAASGNEIWSFGTDGQIISGPLISNGTLYIGSEDGNVYALEAKTGSKIWNYDMGQLGDSSALTISNGLLYIITRDGSLLALNANNGQKVWNFTTEPRSTDYLLPAPIINRGIVYFGSLDNNIYAVNAGSGVKIWNYTTNGQISASPYISDNTLYIGSSDGTVYALKLSNQLVVQPANLFTELIISATVIVLLTLIPILYFLSKRIRKHSSLQA